MRALDGSGIRCNEMQTRKLICVRVAVEARKKSHYQLRKTKFPSELLHFSPYDATFFHSRAFSSTRSTCFCPISSFHNLNAKDETDHLFRCALFFLFFPAHQVSAALVCVSLKFESGSNAAKQRRMEQERGNFCNFKTYYKRLSLSLLPSEKLMRPRR